jgi:hypothetical protein
MEAPIRVHLLCSLDELDHEGGECWFGVVLKQEMSAVENMRLHARQVLHPGQRFGDIDIGVVTAPQHERRRLPSLQIRRDRIENAARLL